MFKIENISATDKKELQRRVKAYSASHRDILHASIILQKRTQPCLPLNSGYTKTRTHDYIRHGTTTLFAALDYLSGKIISRLESRHRHIEWLRFLKQIDRETPKELNIHLIMDNYCTHKFCGL